MGTTRCSDKNRNDQWAIESNTELWMSFASTGISKTSLREQEYHEIGEIFLWPLLFTQHTPTTIYTLTGLLGQYKYDGM